MFESLIALVLRRPMVAFVLALSLGVDGVWAYTQLTIEAFPDPTDTQVQVITLVDGQPTEEVERRVTIPLERALNGTSGMNDVRSISLFGLSFLTLTFQDGVDPNFARQLVKERIDAAELPTGVKPRLGPLATPIGEVYRYTLTGEQKSPLELRTLQEWTVEPQLSRVDGVADVVSYGGLVKEIHVIPDPAKMASLGVGLKHVFAALQKGSDNASGGYVERGAESFVIRSIGLFRTLGDIEQVRVATHEAVPVLVKDIAKVEIGYAPRQGVVARNHDQDAVEGIVLMRRGANPSVVLEALRTRVDELNHGLLPPGVRVEPFYDRTELVGTTLKTVFRNIGEGAGLVVVVLFAFLLSVRASLIVAVVIPLSLGASFLYLHARGMSANLLSIGAVDFGIIVDGAVILVEALFHRFATESAALEARTRSPFEVALDAVREVARPTLFALLIIMTAYVPILALQRVEGRIFAPMAHTVVSALLGALLTSFTLVPVLSVLALRKPRHHTESPVLRVSARLYEPVLAWALRHKTAMLALAVSALGAAGIVLSRLGSEFLPALNEGSLYATFTLPSTVSLTEGRKLVPRIQHLLSQSPEVSELLAQLGRPEDGTDPTLPSNLEVFVKLEPMAEWRPEIRTLDDLSAEMERRLAEIPGLDVNFSQPIRDNVNENISGQFGEVALKIFGEDLEELQGAAEKATTLLQGVAGVSDLGIVKSGEMPQIAISLDRKRLAAFDLDLGDVQDYVETALGGHVACDFMEGEKRFDVTVRLPSAARQDTAAIERIQLPLEDGALIPLSGVAQVKIATGRAAITRQNGRRYVGVRMNVRDRDMGSFVAEAREKVAAGVPLPAGYQVSWGGQFENQERAMRRLRLVVPLALLLTFFLLFSAFGNLGDSLLILLNVPFGLIGGVFGLAAFGMPLSVSAAVGFIALLGQAVLNGVLVVTAIQARLDSGLSPTAAAAAGARDRLRAVLMTGLLASLGLLPAALSHAIGSETQRPLAVVVVTGTISALLLTLVFMPVTWRLAHALRTRIASWAAVPRDIAEPLPHQAGPV